jgi:hypothetical protein
VDASRAYQYESPPPTYTTPFWTVAGEETPALGGMQIGS